MEASDKKDLFRRSQIFWLSKKLSGLLIDIPTLIFKSYFIEFSNKILGMLIGHKWVLGSCLWVILFYLMCWCSQMFNWDSTNHNLPWYVNHVNGCAWVPSGSFVYSNHFDSLTTVIKTALMQILSSCTHCHDSITVVIHDMPRCLHTNAAIMSLHPDIWHECV